MGIIRLLLAVAVVFAHTEFYGWLGDAELAVKLFFMISGFLISFVLHENSAYDNPASFYMSRALRLYPAYFSVALLALAWWFIEGSYLAFFLSLNGPSKVILATTNVMILGQDVVMFLRPTSTGLAFTRDFAWSNPQLWHGLLVPPAWSLSLEITFYLIAPYVLRRPRLLVSLFICSLLLSVLGIYLGLAGGPFSYRFFPFELALFLSGALAERLLRPHIRRVPKFVNWSPLIAGILFCLFPILPGATLPKTLVVTASFALLLPFLAAYNRSHRWDDWLGNFSYPLYISHYLPLQIAAQATAGFAHPHRAHLLIGLPAAVTLTLVVRYGVDLPVERLRRRLRGKPAPTDVASRSRVDMEQHGIVEG